jgi:membrane protease YdiL (CAAX protease family)
MKNKSIKGSIKAGYIFSIMPDSIKSFLMNKLTEPELKKINSALKDIKSITTPNRVRILQEFILQLKQSRLKKEMEIQGSLIVTLTVISILILSAFIYAQIVMRSTSEIVRFIESILENGGMHIIVFPFLWGIVKSEYKRTPLEIIFTTKNPLLDISLSIVVALIISIMFIDQIGNKNYFSNRLLWYFILITALTIGPATEEIFFRFFLFYRSGGKYGYILCGIVSSLLFAAIHIPDSFLLFAKYIISGSLLCGICYARKTVFTSFIAHATTNLIVMLS